MLAHHHQLLLLHIPLLTLALVLQLVHQHPELILSYHSRSLFFHRWRQVILKCTMHPISAQPLGLLKLGGVLVLEILGVLEHAQVRLGLGEPLLEHLVTLGTQQHMDIECQHPVVRLKSQPTLFSMYGWQFIQHFHSH